MAIPLLVVDDEVGPATLHWLQADDHGFELKNEDAGLPAEAKQSPDGPDSLYRKATEFVVRQTGPLLLMVDAQLEVKDRKLRAEIERGAQIVEIDGVPGEYLDGVSVILSAVGNKNLRPLGVILASQWTSARVSRPLKAYLDHNGVYYAEIGDALSELKRVENHETVAHALIQAFLAFGDDASRMVMEKLEEIRERASNLFTGTSGLHNPSDWKGEEGETRFREVRQEVIHLVSTLLRSYGAVSAVNDRNHSREDVTLDQCWELWALKSITHTALHRGLILAVVAGADGLRAIEQQAGTFGYVCDSCGWRYCHRTGCRSCEARARGFNFLWPWKIKLPSRFSQTAALSCARTLVGLSRLRDSGWSYRGYCEGRCAFSSSEQPMFGVSVSQALSPGSPPSDLIETVLGIRDRDRGEKTDGFDFLDAAVRTEIGLSGTDATGKKDALCTIWFEEATFR